MIKGAGTPGVFGGLARNLFKLAAGFSGDELYKIEYEIRNKLSSELFPLVASEKENAFQEQVEQYISAIQGRKLGDFALIRGFDLNKDKEHQAGLPTFLQPQTHSVRSVGFCNVPLNIEDHFPKEMLGRYKELYLENMEMKEIGEMLWHECFAMTYTQMISMFPLVERLWEGRTPKINPTELKTFKFRDNHKYNDKLERVLINAKILGLTKEIRLVPSVSEKGFLVNVHIEETV